MAKSLDELTTRMADPSFFVTPEFGDLLTHLRQHSPVHWCQAWPKRGFWAVTRYADIKWVYEQPLLFSNEGAGNIIPADPDFHANDREAMGFGVMMTNTDPPRHAELRRVFTRFFSGPQVAKLEPLCQRIADDILGELASDEFDFVMDAAAHLPARLISQLLGIPKEDWPLITRYANSFASFADPALQLGASPGETFQIAMKTTLDYIGRLVAERRTAPRDDLCSMAALAEVNGTPLSQVEAAWNAWALLAAGFETSRNVIVGGLYALLQHPDQLARLKADPKLLPSAVDEMLRWTMPATANLRVATEDTAIGGQAIKRGDWVVNYIESANRDETVFPDPFSFDVARRPNPYFSFGHGVHNCIGRMLAMLEVRVMIRTMLERTDAIEIVVRLNIRRPRLPKGSSICPFE